MMMYRNKEITINVKAPEGYVTKLVVKKDTLWISKNLRRLSKEALFFDDYLINIINFVLRGGGFVEFLSIQGVCKNLAEEAKSRGLIGHSTFEQLLKMGQMYEKQYGKRVKSSTYIYDEQRKFVKTVESGLRAKGIPNY